MVDKGRTVSIAHLNFGRAFGTAFHSNLMEKQLKYGLGGPTARWTENVLNSQARRELISGAVSLEVSNKQNIPGVNTESHLTSLSMISMMRQHVCR